MEGYFGMPQREQLRAGMMGLNVVSMPFRAVDAGVSAVCNSTPLAQKVCQVAGKGIEAVGSAAAAVIPEKVKEAYKSAQHNIRRNNVRFAEQMERAHQIPQSETEQWCTSAGIVASAALGAGAGRIAGATYSAAKNLPSIIKHERSLVKPSEMKEVHWNKKSKDDPKYSFYYGNQSTLFYSANMNPSGDMRVYIHLLESGYNAKKEATTFKAFSYLKTYAQERGAKSLEIQFKLENLKLKKLADKKFESMGLRPFIGHRSKRSMFGIQTGIRPVYKVYGYKKGFKANLFSWTMGGMLAGGNPTFFERLQMNGLVEKYNASNPEGTAAEGGASGGELGGILTRAEVIQGLFAEGTKQRDQLFFLPLEGEIPFSRPEFQQVLRELAIGIYYYGSAPLFSLHFSSQIIAGKKESYLYPVTQDFYDQSIVGWALRKADYSMKGFLHGGYLEDSATAEYQKGQRYEEAAFKKQLVDIHHLCQVHLGVQYYSIWELLEQLEKLDQKEGRVDPPEFDALSSYASLGNSSFCLHFSQASFPKTGNLLELDGKVEVTYKFAPESTYVEMLKKFKAEFGRDPYTHLRLIKVFEMMRYQIQTFMPQLPQFRKLFELLKIISFFSSYFKTLKFHQKIPILESIPANHSKVCASLFPPLPIRKNEHFELQLSLSTLIDKLSERERRALLLYLKKANERSLCPDNLMAPLISLFKNWVEKQVGQELSEEQVKREVYRDILNHLLRQCPKGVEEQLQSAQEASRVKRTLLDVIEQCSAVLIEQKETIEKLEEHYLLLTHPLSLHQERLNMLRVIDPARQETLEKIEKIQEILKSLDASKEAMQKNEANLQGRILSSQTILKQGEKEFKRVESTLQQPLESFLSSTLFTIPLDIPMLKPLSEQRPELQEQAIRLVGGCILDISPQQINYAPQHESLLSHYFSDIEGIESETLVPVQSSSGQKGYLFKLNMGGFPAAKNSDYAWMPFMLHKDREPITIVKGVAFSAIEKGESKALREALKEPDALTVRDPQGATLLHQAAAGPSKSCLILLLRAGLSPNTQDHLGFTPLHYAARAGRRDNIRLLLKKEPKLLNIAAKNQESPLYVAVQYRQREAAQDLQAAGAHVNLRTLHGMTPLYAAIHHEFSEIALDLLKHPKIDVDCRLEDGTTPLYAAVDLKQEGLVEALLQRGADPNKARTNGFSPLHVASQQGHVKNLELLLKDPRTQVNLRLKSNQTALHLAVAFPACVELLLKSGADATLSGWNQETPLMSALEEGNTHSALLIIQHAGYKLVVQEKRAGTIQTSTTQIGYRLIEAPNLLGETPLQRALEQNLMDVVSLLLFYAPGMWPAKVNIPDPLLFLEQLCRKKADPLFISQFIKSEYFNWEQKTGAFKIAAQNGHMQLLTLLQPYQPRDFCDHKGWSSIHYAARFDDIERLRQFLKGAPKDPLQPTKARHTLASIAAENGSLRCLKLLLEEMHKRALPLEKHVIDAHLLTFALRARQRECVDAIIHHMSDLNIPLDSQKRYAVHIATENGDVEMLDLLRSRGARFDVTNGQGKTPFHLAYEYQWSDVIAYLFDKKWELTLPTDFNAVAAFVTEPQILFLTSKEVLPSSAFGKEALLCAIRENNFPAFRALHLQGHSISTLLNYATSYRRTIFIRYILKESPELFKTSEALHTAAKQGHEELITLLLKANFDPQRKNKQGSSSIELAKESGYPNCVLLLENREKELQTLKEKLTSALTSQNETLFFELIKKLPLNESLVFRLENSSTPLLHLIYHFSKKNKNSALLERFLKLKGVQKETQNSEGETIYHLMAQQGEPLPKECQLTLKNRRGTSVLHYYAGCAESRDFENAMEKYPRFAIDTEDKEGFTPLFYAIQGGKPETAALLLKKGADPNHLSKSRKSPLYSCILEKNVHIAKLLMEQGAELDLPCQSIGRSALITALEQGEWEIAQRLIQQGANVTYQDALGVCPILSAAKQGSLRMLRLLQAAGASLHVKDHEGKNCAHYAAQSSDPSLLDYLKESGVPLDKKSRVRIPSLRKSCLVWEGLTPLHVAAQKGRIKMLQKLEALGCSLEEPHLLASGVSSDRTEVVLHLMRYPVLRSHSERALAIQMAIRKDSPQMIEILYQGLSFDLPLNEKGVTGLQFAANKGAKRALEFFLKQRSALSASDLLAFAVEGGDLYQVRRLVSALDPKKREHFYKRVEDFSQSQIHKELNQQRKEGKTYLHNAVQRGHLEMAALLLELGADPNQIDYQGNTSLHLAAIEKNPPLISLLLACGSDSLRKNAKNQSAYEIVPNTMASTQNLMLKYQKSRVKSEKWGDSPLHSAVRLQEPAHFTLLLKRENLRSLNKRGESALHLAVTRDLRLTQLLLHEGADLEQRDSQGRTALFVAVTRGQQLDIIECLLQRGADLAVLNHKGQNLLEAITQRKEPIALKIFKYLHAALPKFYVEDPMRWSPLGRDEVRLPPKEPAPAIREAVQRDDLSLFFQLVHQGHPACTQLLQQAVIAGAHKIVYCLVHWFGLVTNSSNRLYLGLTCYKNNDVATFKALSKVGLNTPFTAEMMQRDDLYSLHFFYRPLDFYYQIAPQSKNPLLHEAAAANSVKILKFLLWLGLDKELPNHLGNTPLHIAAMLHNKECVQALIEQGSPLNNINHAGWTPLSASLLSKPNSGIPYLLYKAGADLNVEHGGITQLQQALLKNQPEVFNALLLLGAQPIPYAERAHSELQLILKSKNLEFLRIYALHAQFFKEEQMLQDLRTLYLQSMKTDPNTLKFLTAFSLWEGADKQSLLHLAQKTGHREIIQLVKKEI